jgi:hypothetical protein
MKHTERERETVKFIRKGTVGRKEREAFPVLNAGNGSKDSKLAVS